MVRSWSLVLGIGLLILWIVGMNDRFASAWLVWLDGAAALVSFLVAGSASEDVTLRKDAAGPSMLAFGLFGLYAVGLAAGAATWLVWWNFAFAVVYAIVGVSAYRGRTEIADEGGVDVLDRLDKSA